MCPFSSWVLHQAALEMSKVNIYNIRTKMLTCCLYFWTSINASVTQSSREEGAWLVCRRILSLLASFFLLVSLAVIFSGSVFPVLGLLIGAVSWGEDQYGANLLGRLVMAATEILKNTEMHKKKWQITADMLYQPCNDDWWLYCWALSAAQWPVLSWLHWLEIIQAFHS